jgi:hypothetical protein
MKRKYAGLFCLPLLLVFVYAIIKYAEDLESMIVVIVSIESDNESVGKFYFNSGSEFNENEVAVFHIAEGFGDYAVPYRALNTQIQSIRLDLSENSNGSFCISHISLRRGYLGGKSDLMPLSYSSTHQLESLSGKEAGFAGFSIAVPHGALPDPYVVYNEVPPLEASFLRHVVVLATFGFSVYLLLVFILIPPGKKALSFYLSILFVLFVLYIRNYYKFETPALYGEDGPVFFLGAFDGLASIFQPYNGYVHLVQRIFALFAHHFPVVFTPHIYLTFSVLVHLFVVRILFSSRLSLRQPWLWAVATVAVSQPIEEIYANLTNIQWLLAVVPIACLFAPYPSEKKRLIGDSVAIVILGLTGPFLSLLAPAFAAKAIFEKSKYGMLFVLIIMLPAMVQFWNIYGYVTNIDFYVPVENESIGLIQGSFRYFGYYFLGSHILVYYFFPSASQNLEVALGGVFVLVFLAIAVLFFFRNKERWDVIKLAVVVLIGIACILVPSFLKDNSNITMRYMYLALIATSGLMIEIPKWKTKWIGVVFGYFVALIVMQIVMVPKPNFMVTLYGGTNYAWMRVAPLLEDGIYSAFPVVMMPWNEDLPSDYEDYVRNSKLLYRYRFK